MSVKSIFVCGNCGYESPKWFGKCQACGEWNTAYEEKDVNKTGTKSKRSKGDGAKAIKLKEIKNKKTERIKTGIEELERVLGGGFVEGSLTLIGGEPRNSESQL